MSSLCKRFCRRPYCQFCYLLVQFTLTDKAIPYLSANVLITNVSQNGAHLFWNVAVWNWINVLTISLMSNHPRPFIYVIMLVLLKEIAVIRFFINIMDIMDRTRKKKILYVFFYMQCSLIRVSYWDSSNTSFKCFFWIGYTYHSPPITPLTRSRQPRTQYFLFLYRKGRNSNWKYLRYELITYAVYKYNNIRSFRRDLPLN